MLCRPPAKRLVSISVSGCLVICLSTPYVRLRCAADGACMVAFTCIVMLRWSNTRTMSATNFTSSRLMSPTLPANGLAYVAPAVVPGKARSREEAGCQTYRCVLSVEDRDSLQSGIENRGLDKMLGAHEETRAASRSPAATAASRGNPHWLSANITQVNAFVQRRSAWSVARGGVDEQRPLVAYSQRLLGRVHEVAEERMRPIGT
jgi:hypothetical protein